MLCLVSLAAAVLYGVSWDNTDRAKGEDGVDLAMLIVFLAVPLGLAAVRRTLSMCYPGVRNDCLCDSGYLSSDF